MSLEEILTFVSLRDDAEKFELVCGGCNRLFRNESNFNQHFFCPWSGTEKSRKKLRHIRKETPLCYIGSQCIYTAEEFASGFSDLWMRKNRYSRKSLWEKCINIFLTLDTVIQNNILYFLPEQLKKYLTKKRKLNNVVKTV
jgi:hypothetical protein